MNMRQKKNQGLAIFGAVLGLVLANFFTENFQLVVMSVLLLGLLVYIAYELIKGEKSESLKVLFLTIPIIIGFLGVYFDKLILLFSGIGLLFLVILILNIITKKK